MKKTPKDDRTPAGPKSGVRSSAATISLWLFLGLLAYMPLHILLSTWVGTSFGVLEVARVTKEGFLLLGAGLALVVGWQKGVVRPLLQDKLVWLITAFVGLNILLALVRRTDQDAELLGLAYNVRFLIYFVWAMILAKLYDRRELGHKAVKITLAVGLLVLVFGVVQYVFLPDTALKHLGYKRANGVLPAFFIDDKPDLERIMSTVRDPNSFGSYVLILVGLSSVFVVAKKFKDMALGYVLLAGLCVFLTFSRAAWMGAVATVAVAMYFFFTRRRERFARYKLPLVFGCATLVITGILGLLVFKDNYVVKNVVFHADESTVLADPNELRVRFWRESVKDIADEPLGSGPGTAGLASIRNNKRTVLNENYYLQTAQETGIFGLGLFLAIVATVAWRLYLRAYRRRPVAIALLASLAGLTLTNFLAHIWANEAVAYTWWGLAGLAAWVPPPNRPLEPER
jgi:hypothetical protein